MNRRMFMKLIALSATVAGSPFVSIPKTKDTLFDPAKECGDEWLSTSWDLQERREDIRFAKKQIRSQVQLIVPARYHRDVIIYESRQNDHTDHLAMRYYIGWKYTPREYA